MSSVYDSSVRHAALVTFARDGSPLEPIPATEDIYINCRNLNSLESVNHFCEICQDEDFATRVKIVDLSGASLADQLVCQLLTNGIQRLSNIIELNLSYIHLGFKAIGALCAMVDVKISGMYCIGGVW